MTYMYDIICMAMIWLFLKGGHHSKFIYHFKKNSMSLPTFLSIFWISTNIGNYELIFSHLILHSIP